MPTFIVANNPGLKKSITLTSKDEHHLVRVMRAQVGEVVTLTDNEGMTASASITAMTPLKFNILEIKAGEAALPITVCLPLIQQERLEWAAEKLCELNIDTIQLIITERTQFQHLPPAKFQRLINSAISAQKQCGRTTPLHILEPVKLDQIKLDDATQIVIASPANHQEIKSQSVLPIPSTRTFLFIGPEGGFSENDFKFFENKKNHKISLGETILRTETAAIIFTGLLKSQCC